MSTRNVSRAAAWAVAFGCATGWGSFIMPGTTFLPAAGPLGTALGVLVGGLVMAVVGWNYSRMVDRHPGPGGALAYVRETFGVDHGFLCAWFLVLAYVSIVWANATALTLVTRALFGDLFSFGPHYSIAGYEIFLGDLLLSGAAVALAAAANLRPRLAARAQVGFAAVFVLGVAVVFAAALWRRAGGGAPPLPPAFAPDGGPRLAQVLRIVALAPWLYVGFEAVSHLSGEFRFPARRAFGPMAAGLAASVAVYAALAALPALRSVAPGAAPPAPLPADTLAVPTFRSAVAALGAAGMAVIGLAAVGAIFTNLVGNTMVASRLVSSMAAEGVLPAALAATREDGAPRRAVLAIAAVSLFVPLLGRTAIGFIVDVTTVGAAVAYVYVSAAALRTARSLPPGPARRRDEIAGSLGAVLSLAIAALFLLPNLLGGGSLMATESYFILAVWCVAGIVVFLAACRRDREHRFGRSPIVWLGMLALVLFLSVTWMRQSTFEATEEVFGDIEGRPAAGAVFATLEDGKARLERSILRNSLVQTATTVLSFVLLLGLYAVLRRRELDMEDEKARAKSYFFSTVSHDIRTPLNAIIGYSEMLRQGIRDADEREKALDSIVVSGRTLLGLVNDVLDLSKLESGKMEIEPEPTDCPRLLGELADAFRATISAPALELRCRPGAMPLLMLDPQRLRQIGFNLVGNAVKFTERGHVEVRASWTPDADGADGAAGTFRLDVEDTGCGIGKEDLARIASAYVQVGSKTGRNGGTGLGLAICKQLAAAMGGRLEAVSEPGRGSTFSLVVPGVRAAGEAEKAAARAAAEAEAAAARPAPAPARPVRRVLVVDDVPINLMVLSAQLRNLGDFKIETAPEGRAALERLEHADGEPFDLVLTDMWMPVMDGEGLVRSIRERPALRGLRVVAVTADVELQGKTAEMGFDGILLKPVTADKLRLAMANLFPNVS